jgi:prepilin peptidase CpaA
MALYELPILALVAALSWAAVNDALWFRIPNVVPLLIAALYPVFLLTSGKSLETGLWGLVVAVGVFLLGFFAFARGVMGGGDVKLLTALSLWAGPAYLPALVLVVAIAGGVLSLIVLLSTRNPYLAVAASKLRTNLRLPPVPSVAQGGRTVPYAIAIAAGGLLLARQLHLSALS